MKTFIWILVGLAAVSPVLLFLFQKLREKGAQGKGVVVYATVLSMEPLKAFGKPSGIMKVTLSLQEPGEPMREVTLRSRLAPGQKITAGVMLAVVVDPKDKKRVFPAGPEAQKRVQRTGSRDQRRQMKKKGL